MKVSKPSEDDKKSVIITERYKKRISLIKKGQEFSARGDVVKSIEYYKSYLNILCEYHDVTDDKLSPSLFPGRNEQAEIFIISQVLFDMAKTFDRNDKTRPLVAKYLNLYIKFSVGFKFHRVNADILRKFIKQSAARNMDPFKQAYERMKIASKGCYIATHCFGEHHQTTCELRLFKNFLMTFKAGSFLVGEYYHYSPILIDFCSKHFLLNSILKFIAIPILRIIANLSKRLQLNEPA